MTKSTLELPEALVVSALLVCLTVLLHKALGILDDHLWRRDRR